MKFLKVTYVDSVTEISVATEPARNGPKLPPVRGLTYVWARESAWPTDVPEFFCTCPDDSQVALDGVLSVLDETDWRNMQLDEMRARKPQVITPRQARLALAAQPSPDPAHANLLAYVESGFAALPEPDRTNARISWEYATEVRREDAFVTKMSAALQLTGEQLDELFAVASAL